MPHSATYFEPVDAPIFLPLHAYPFTVLSSKDSVPTSNPVFSVNFFGVLCCVTGSINTDNCMAVCMSFFPVVGKVGLSAFFFLWSLEFWADTTQKWIYYFPKWSQVNISSLHPPTFSLLPALPCPSPPHFHHPFLPPIYFSAGQPNLWTFLANVVFICVQKCEWKGGSLFFLLVLGVKKKGCFTTTVGWARPHASALI